MLPFQITGMLGFQSKTHGFVLVNEEGIRLVFREADDIKKAWDDEAEFLLIKWDNLAGIKVVRGLISDELKISVKVMIGDEPDGKNDNVIELELQKRDRDKLDRFEKHVKDYQSGKRKDDVDDVLDDVRDMLDRM